MNGNPPFRVTTRNCSRYWRSIKGRDRYIPISARRIRVLFSDAFVEHREFIRELEQSLPIFLVHWR